MGIPFQIPLGSPLFCQERGLWFLLGVSASGGCRGGHKTPPKFTPVAPQERWLSGAAREVLFSETPPDPRDEEREELEGLGDPQDWDLGGPENLGAPRTPTDPENLGNSGNLGTSRDPEMSESPGAP